MDAVTQKIYKSMEQLFKVFFGVSLVFILITHVDV